MRVIAITKPCVEAEKELVLSAVEKEDNVLFFDSEEEMLNIKKFIISCGSPEKIELLPYHAMGEHKYAAIGKQVQTFSVPSKEKISQLKRVFV